MPTLAPFPPLPTATPYNEPADMMELHMQPEEIWQAVLGELQLALQRPVYDNWLRDTSLVAFENGRFVIAVKTAFAQEWLEKRMKGMIKRRLQRLSGRSIDLQFIVRAERPAEAESTQPPPPLLQSSDAASSGRFVALNQPEQSTLRPDMTFDTFIEGEGNRIAVAAAQAVAFDPGTRYNPLFLYGGVGLGKTHLLHAIGNAAAQAGYTVKYVTSETFTNELIEAIRRKANVQFRQAYRDVDILLVDDIQFIQGKDSTQNEFFHTFNSLYAANKQIVITSDRPPHLLNKLEDRLSSRFEGGLTTDIQPPSLEHRIAILQAKAAKLGTAVPMDVLRFIAERYNNNVRELQGALNRVTAYAQLSFMPIDLALAQQVLVKQEAPIDDSPDSILQAVAEEFRVSVSELTGPRRVRRVVVPRQLAMHLMREFTQLSFPQIGEIMGGRDHTTVMYGTEKFQERMEQDPELKKRLEKVRIRLQT